MTKFLRQGCQYEAVILGQDGSPVLDIYGEAEYAEPERLPCRKEATTVDIVSQGGSLLRSQYVYYLDSAVPIHLNDRLDGLLVLDVSTYVDGRGSTIGYECRT